MRYNRYRDDFLIDEIQPDEIGEELVSVGELVADEEWQIINDSEHYLQEDYPIPERETDLEQSQIERRGNTNFRILEWMRDLKTSRRRSAKYPAGPLVSGKKCENEISALRLDSNRPAT